MQPLCAIPDEILGGYADDVGMVRPFDRVPDHLLVSLLRHLNVRDRLLAEFVCRRWRRVALDAAWTHVRAFDYDALLNDGSLPPAPRLTVEMQRQATALLESVVERADLKELTLTSAHFWCPYAQPLELISRICSLWPALTALDVSRLRLTNSALCTIGAQLGGRLRSLSMGFCFETRNVESGLGSLFVNCANLEHLDISYNWGVTGTSSFAALPVTLKSFNVDGCRHMSDAWLRCVAERCSAIEQLQIGYNATLSSAAIQQHLGQLGSLRSLKFTHYAYHEDNFAAVGRLANLQRLEFRCTSISDQTLLAVATGCKQLHTVMMSSPLYLDSLGFGALARLPNLTRLELSDYNSMTDAPLIAIAECGQLEVLSVRGCSLMTDAALERVASCCKALRRLDASDCPLVGDVTLLALLELVQRRATADSLHVWLWHTAATQPAIVAHANLMAFCSSFAIREIEAHQQAFNLDEVATDFTATAIFKNSTDAPTLTTDQAAFLFSLKQLRKVLFDLWIAGMETTVTTLRWAFLYMLRYPEIQRKIQQEIDDAVGSDVEIRMAHKSLLPYTVATLQETQRFGNIVPLDIHRRTVEKVEVCGYEIPADTLVVAQVATVHVNPEYFPQPDEFKPERFLEADGKAVRKVDHLLPFSLGKRQCPGESLARMEIFLVCAAFMQKFQIGLPDGAEPPTLKGELGMTLTPARYRCLVKKQ